MARVSRPTITSWEKQDFPPSRRSGGQDHFRQSDVLSWLDRRTVPATRLARDEGPGTTYGARARHHLGDEPSGGARPPALLAQGTGAPRPEDAAIVKDLMGPLVDRVRGTATVVDYLNLLCALHYLRSADGPRWTEVQSAAAALNGLDSAAHLLRLIGRSTDENLKRFSVTSDLTEALGRLEPRTARDLHHVIDRVARLRSNVFELILCEYEERAALGSREFFTPRGVTRLMVGLTGAASGHDRGRDRPVSFYDPFARSGELLVEAATFAAEAAEGRSVAVRGETRRADTWRLANMNLALNNVRPSIELSRSAPWQKATGRQPVGGADYVLTNPPFNMTDPAREERLDGQWPYGAPPVDNDNFAYVQHCLAALRPGGRAVIVMPTKAGNSGNRAEREIRANLVENGLVESVIALPPRLFSGTPVPVSLWVLRHPESPAPDVLFLDARRLGAKTGPRRTLGPQDVDAVLRACELVPGAGDRTDEPGGGEPTAAAVLRARVPREVLRARSYSLSPIDHVRRDSDGAEPAGLFAAARDRLGELSVRTASLLTEAAELPYLSPEDAPVDSVRITSTVRLSELCELKAGPSYSRLGQKERAEGGPVPVVYPKHLKEGWISDARDESVSDGTATALGHFSLQPNDIVCVRSGQIGTPALVLPHQTGWLMSPNVIRLRPRTDTGVLPEYLHHYLSREDSVGWIRDRAAATAAPSISTESLGGMEIPLPSPADQRKVVSALTHLTQLDRLLKELAAAAQRTRSTLADTLMGPSASGAEGPDAPASLDHPDKETPL